MPDQQQLWAEWIVGDLLALTPADRQWALERACDGDEALRDRVNAILQSTDSAALE